MIRTGLGVCLALVWGLGLQASAPEPSWPQFGGPERDFRVVAPDIEPWGEGGPVKLWERELGDGYSGIVASGGVLYTMCRPSAWFGLRTGAEELAVAIDADSGRTIWEHREPVEELPGMNLEHGPGPHSTPLLADGRVYTVGVTGRLQALDARTGAVAWSKELWKDLGGKVMDRGYSCSPLAWRDTVIVAVGARDAGLAAFSRSDGVLRWKSPALAVSPSSPVVVDVDGEEQLLYFAADEVVGLDPATGARLWGHPHSTSYGLNIALPVAGEGGSRTRCACTTATSSSSAGTPTGRAGTSVPRPSPPSISATGA